MLKWNKEDQFKKNLSDALNEVPVPESLIQFAKEVPYRNFEIEPVSETPSHRRKKRVFPKIAAASVVALAVSIGAVGWSPAFAQLVKDIPGFSIAASWLEKVRGYDGVNQAHSNGYTPIPAVVQQKGDVTVSINDIYLTSDQLSFKTLLNQTTSNRTSIKEKTARWMSIGGRLCITGSLRWISTPRRAAEGAARSNRMTQPKSLSWYRQIDLNWDVKM